MIGIRKHTLSSGDALDRRRMVELFMEAAKRFTSIHRDSIGNKQFGRTKFGLDSWEEYQSNYQVDIQYLIPQFGHQSPGSGLVVVNDDSFFEGQLTWNAGVQVASDSSFRILGWPVIDGQAVWAGESWSETDTLFDYAASPTDPATYTTGTAYTNNAYLSLGGCCNVKGLNGRTYTGILFASVGKFKVFRLQTNLRKRV